MKEILLVLFTSMAAVTSAVNQQCINKRLCFFTDVQWYQSRHWQPTINLLKILWKQTLHHRPGQGHEIYLYQVKVEGSLRLHVINSPGDNTVRLPQLTYIIARALHRVYLRKMCYSTSCFSTINKTSRQKYYNLSQAKICQILLNQVHGSLHLVLILPVCLWFLNTLSPGTRHVICLLHMHTSINKTSFFLKFWWE